MNGYSVQRSTQDRGRGTSGRIQGRIERPSDGFRDGSSDAGADSGTDSVQGQSEGRWEGFRDETTKAAGQRGLHVWNLPPQVPEAEAEPGVLDVMYVNVWKPWGQVVKDNDFAILDWSSLDEKNDVHELLRGAKTKAVRKSSSVACCSVSNSSCGS